MYQLQIVPTHLNPSKVCETEHLPLDNLREAEETVLYNQRGYLILSPLLFCSVVARMPSGIAEYCLIVGGKFLLLKVYSLTEQTKIKVY